jgi:ABC-type uncharacterized transport system permease subunit
MIPFISIVASLAYLAASGVQLRRLLGGIASVGLSPRPPLVLASGGLLLHAYLLVETLFAPGGLRLGLFSAGSLVAWCVSLVLVVTALRKPVLNLAIAVFPVTALLLLAGGFRPLAGPVTSAGNPGLDLHILASLVAYSLLTLAAVQALLLALQDRHLRNHHPGGIVRAMPPLQTMEALLFQIIAVGELLLSVALLSGFVYLEDIFAQHLMHKTVLSIFAWLVFAVLLWGRWRLGWRGKLAIRWTLAGFVALMLAYFGSKFVLELVLQRV